MCVECVGNSDCGGAKPLCKAGICAAGTWTAQTPLGNGEGSGQDQFKNPMDVVLSADGLEMYVADGSNARVAVWKRASAGSPWSAQTPIGNGRGANSDQFMSPAGVTLSLDGLELYVADREYFDGPARIAVWKRADTTKAWVAQTPIGQDEEPMEPMGLTLSPDDLELYVADAENECIAWWTRPDKNSPWTEQPALETGLDEPEGVTISVDGLTLYIADTDDWEIAVWTRPDTASAWAPAYTIGSGNGQFERPARLTVSTDGLDLYVTDPLTDDDNSQVKVWTQPDTASAWASAYTIGNGRGSGTNQFDEPQGLTLSPDGLELYVADKNNDRIAVWKYE